MLTRDVAPGDAPKWSSRSGHRQWLADQAHGLLAFHAASLDPCGGFHDLDDGGRPMPLPAGRGRQIHATARMVHAYAAGRLLGHPGSDDIVDHGMAFLWDRHRDAARGGYFWEVETDGASDGIKQAYGHAFVLLAAASAKVVGHPNADRLLADGLSILEAHFWDETYGAVAEEFDREFQPISRYRGQNANMHLVEALMAVFEVTSDAGCLAKAERIADLLIGRHAARHAWRVPEHFDDGWQVDAGYSGDPMFRPPGTTPGHGLEWARLLIQLWHLGGRRHGWMPEAAKALFLRATADGWMESGGFIYTVGPDGSPLLPNRFWWPCCEGIGAASVLAHIESAPTYEHWYRKIWTFCADHLIDFDRGGWYPEVDTALRPASSIFRGKPDIYHALQACLVPLLPPTGSVVRGLATVGLR